MEHRVEEALPLVPWVGQRLPFAALDPGARQRVLAYIHALTPDVAAHRLYEALEGKDSIARAAAALLRAAPLVRLDKTLAALRGSSSVARLALQTISAHQPVYGVADLELLKSLIDTIPQVFPVRAERTTSKGLLGTRERWTCGFCDESGNGEDDARCKKCGRDPAGFFEGDLTASAAIALLTARQQALTALLSESSDG